MSLVSQNLWDFTRKYFEELDEIIDHDRDYLIDYFGFKTLERAYLFKLNNVVVERIQHMWMRVAVGIHGDMNDPNSLNLVKETYNLSLFSLIYLPPPPPPPSSSSPM